MNKDTATFEALRIARQMEQLGMEIDTELCSCATGGTFHGEAMTANGGNIEITVKFHPHELEEEGSLQLEKILGVKFSRSEEQQLNALAAATLKIQAQIKATMAELLSDLDDDDVDSFGNGFAESNPYQRPGFLSQIFGRDN